MVEQRVWHHEVSVLHHFLQHQSIGAEHLVAKVAIVGEQLDLQDLMALHMAGHWPLESLQQTSRWMVAQFTEHLVANVRTVTAGDYP